MISSGQVIVSHDTAICIGGSATLTGILLSGGYGTTSYTFETVPYHVEALVTDTAVDTAFRNNAGVLTGNHDDTWAGPFPIGFPFCFLDQTYTQYWVGSNGWIGFTNPINLGWTIFTPFAIPDTAPNIPKNAIFAPYQDWYPTRDYGQIPQYNVFRHIITSPPNSKLVVYWNNCPFYGCAYNAAGYPTGTFQIVLNEQNSIIENNITNKPYCSWQTNAATQGVHNADGRLAFIAFDRNANSWTASNESTRFVPNGTTWYENGYPLGPIAGYGDTVVVSPAVTTTYACVINTCGGTIGLSSVLVTVVNPAFNYGAASYCKGPATPSPVVTQPGGTFTASPGGLVFTNPVTGQIDLSASTAGTYTVTYTISIPAICSAVQTVTIYDQPAAPDIANPLINRCGPGQVSFSGTVSAHQTIYWYDAPTGGTKYPFTGQNVTTVIPVTTVFYAETYDSTTTCISATRSSVTATVKPVPAINNVSFTDSICSETMNSILVSTTIPGCTFSWTGTNTVGNVSGFSPSGITNPISNFLTNNLFTTGEVTYNVIPDLNGCPGPSKNFKAEVKPKPDAWFQPPSDTVCAGTSKTIHILSHTAGTFFTWTATGTPSISGYSNGSGNQILQPLFNSSLNEGTTTYTVTPVAASCNGNQYSTQRTVFPVPVVTLTTCTDTMTTLIAKPITLKGGIPLGGTYSGSGVNSLTGIFTPSLAGTGTHTITYTYANRFGCPVAATLRIRVFNPAAFTCGDNLLDIRDGRTYPTVDIGTQCWMAANLNYGTRIISTQVQRDNCQAEKYCYNNINANCGPYGGFYQWDEMMQYQDAVGIQGFCPPGWHIPSEAEWNTLFTHYINNGFAAAALKSTGFSGFNAGLFGTNYLNHSPDFFNFATMIWSSTSHGPVKAWAHGMNDPDASASYYPASRANAFQVRCLKD